MKVFDSFEEEVKATVKGLLNRKWKVDKVEKENGKVESVRIHAKCFGIDYYMWIDIIYTVGGEITWNWNQYIFDTNNSFDCIYRELQKNIDFVQNVDCLVADYI